MEYHDVITDCASISLDAIEGTLEGLRGRAQNLNTIPKRHGNFSAQSSLQYVSLSSQSSITSVTLDQGSTINDALASHRGSLWSPSHSYSSSTMAPVVHTATLQGTVTRNPQLKDLQSQLSNEENFPLDLAVEAKPEEVNSSDVNLVQEEDNSSFKQKLMKMPSNESKSEKQCSEDKSTSLTENIFKDSDKDLHEMSSLEILSTSTEKQILQGVEAKEEETDKEVSELTSLPNKPLEEFSDEERLDTPFCSTTQNLTADLKNLQSCEEVTTEKLTKSHDEDVDEMYNSMQDAEDENYVPPFSRYRYLSHCGPPPVIPSEAVQKPKVFRSNSCPAKLCPSQSSVVPEKNCIVDSVSKTETVVATCSSSVITPSGAFAISNNVILSSASRNLTYEQLIPMAMDPLPDILSRPPNANLESNYNSYNTMFRSLSPNDLLDNYVLLGNVTYTSQQSSIPITSTKSTDWTHFGGKPPPDEVEILRNQILLLHNQLRFERHRKDVHSERIRRILGRAKKSKMQEELIIALKEQITLLVKENEELKVEVSKKTEILEQFKLEKKLTEMELNSLIKKLSLENTQLLFSNKNMQNLLVSQKEENDRIIAACKFSQEQIVNLETESNLCRQEVECCRKLKKEAEFLSKQLFLLQEVNTLYKEKIDKLKEPSNTSDMGEELYDSAASIEINDLKMKLETTCYQLNATKCRIVELEQLINNMKQKEKDHHQIIEQLKSYQKDEIKVCEEHLAEIKRIAVEKDSFILQLFKEKEILSENLVTLEKKLSGASPIVKELCSVIPSSEQGTSSPAAHSSDCSRDNSRS